LSVISRVFHLPFLTATLRTGPEVSIASRFVMEGILTFLF